MSRVITKHDRNIGTMKHIIAKKREIERKKIDKIEMESPWTTKKVEGTDEYITRK